jgi:hypothetical protein
MSDQEHDELRREMAIRLNLAQHVAFCAEQRRPERSILHPAFRSVPSDDVMLERTAAVLAQNYGPQFPTTRRN